MSRVLITGAADGLGREAARQLVRGRAVARPDGTAIDDDGQTVNTTAAWWHASLLEERR